MHLGRSRTSELLEYEMIASKSLRQFIWNTPTFANQDLRRSKLISKDGTCTRK